MQHRVLKLALAAVVVVAISCDSRFTTPNNKTQNKLLNFTATINAAGEVPTNTSTATGLLTATLDTATNLFTYDFSFTGLSSNFVGGHIHGPAAVGVNSGVILNFTTLPGATFPALSPGVRAGSGRGAVTLNAATQISTTVNGDSLRKLLLAGLTYVNIHSVNIPGGEIRGQVILFVQP